MKRDAGSWRTLPASASARTLAPGIRLGPHAGRGRKKITLAMVADAMKLSGLEFTEDEHEGDGRRREPEPDALRGAARASTSPTTSRRRFHFSAIVPGMEVNRTKLPFTPERGAGGEASGESRGRRVLAGPSSRRARCARRQVTSVELTEMYLARLHRYNGKLNNVVTFLDDYGRAEAKRADAEIAAGKYKGPLHGIPWGAKDIISVKGFKTTWGSPAFKDQVVRLRRERHRDAARRRRRADRQADRPASWRAATNGSADRRRIRGT